MYRKITRLALGAKCGSPGKPPRPGAAAAPDARGASSDDSVRAPRPNEVRPRKVRRVMDCRFEIADCRFSEDGCIGFPRGSAGLTDGESSLLKPAICNLKSAIPSVPRDRFVE